jgi:hypothetical protein
MKICSIATIPILTWLAGCALAVSDYENVIEDIAANQHPEEYGDDAAATAELMQSQPPSQPQSTILVVTSDGQRIQIDSSIGEICYLINTAIENAKTDNTIPLLLVTASDIMWINQWYSIYKSRPQQFDSQEMHAYVQRLYDDPAPCQSTLIQLTNAVHFLNIRPMYNLLTQAIADLIKDRAPEEVRKEFCI